MNSETDQPLKTPGAAIRRRLYPLLWFVAAADEKILSYCPAPEQDKHAGVGMTILITAVAAVLSGYFAFYSIMQAWYTALPVALFWGFIIFNLDRFMVGSMRKNIHGKWWKELPVAMPRVALAVFIALLISKPVEVKIFEKQIIAGSDAFVDEKLGAELMAKKQEISSSVNIAEQATKNKEAVRDKMQDCQNAPGWTELNNHLQECKEKEKDLRNSINSYRIRRARQEKNSRNYLNLSYQINVKNREIKELHIDDKQRQADSVCNSFRQSMDKDLKEADAKSTYHDSLSKQLRMRKDSTENIRNALKKKALESIIGQLEVLHSIRKKEASTNAAGWLVMLLFFTLETAPLLVKIISPRGEYDSHLHISEIRAMEMEKIEKEEARQRTMAFSSVAIEKSQKEAETEQKAHAEFSRLIQEAQHEIAEKIVETWKQEELKKIDTQA